MNLSIRLAACLALLFMVACSSKQSEQDQLAVAKLAQEEIEGYNFLPLNDDMPGTPVDVQRYLVPDKFNIVVYFSPYDGECARLGPWLKQLSAIRPDLAIRTVNINRPEMQQVDWQSPVVQECRISTLPYVQIYEPSLNLRAQGRPAYEQLKQWIRQIQNARPLAR